MSSLSNKLIASSTAFCCLAIISCANTDLSDNDKLLETYPSMVNKDKSYQLSLSQCKQPPCRIEVQLLHKQQIIDKQALPWKAGSQDIFIEQVGKWHGFGDPLDNNSQYTAWTIGTEHENVSIIAQLVNLGNNNDGLLVVQVAGFEHIRRHHLLYSAQGDKLALSWQQKEASGPTWSTVILPNEPSHNNILYLSATQYSTSGTDYFDELDIQNLIFDKTSSRLKTTTAINLPLYYIVIYPFQDKQKAVQLLSKNRNCLDDSILVIDTNKELTSINSNAALTAVTHNAELARLAMKTFKQCIPDKSVKIIKQP